MITDRYETYRPSAIPNLVFDDKKSCLEFEAALRDLLGNAGWRSEWKRVTKLIYSKSGYFNTVINLLEDPSYVAKFNNDVSPIISNLLWLSENAVEIITENESVDLDNTYYPVLCFLAYKY